MQKRSDDGTNEDLLAQLLKDVEMISEAVALGQHGDMLNLVNVLVAMGECSGNYHHPLIHTACRRLLHFPRSYPAEGFWDILLRFDTAAYAGVCKLEDRHGVVSKLIREYGVKSHREQLPSERGEVSVELLTRFTKRFLDGQFLQEGHDPRITVIFLHYLIMLRDHCGITIKPTVLEKLSQLSIFSAWQTVHDSQDLRSETIYKRLAITCHVLTLLGKIEAASVFVDFLIELLTRHAPPFDQAAFLIWDFGILVESGQIPPAKLANIQEARRHLTAFLLHQRKEDIKKRSILDIRELAMFVIGASWFLKREHRDAVSSILDKYAIMHVLCQIRHEVMLNVANASRRKYIEDFLKQFQSINTSEFIEKLHKYISANIKREDELYEHVRSVKEIVESSAGDSDCVAALLATVFLIKNIPGYIVYLDPEFSRPGHIFVEWIDDLRIRQQESSQDSDTVPVDPLYANYGKIAPIALNKQDKLIRIPINDMIEWDSDRLLSFIQDEKRLLLDFS